MKTIYFEKETEFIKASADYILKEALSNTAKKNFFTISLTGGSTPPKIYEMLAKAPYRDKFPWEKTYFFIGDERILPTENPESNVFMINRTLFYDVDIPEENKILPDVSLDNPEAIAKDYALKIKYFFKTQTPSFDLFLLGMGMDCHTASLFPNDSVWKHNDNLVVSTSKPAGEPEVFRVSMGLPLINQSKNVLMLISGSEKKKIAEELLKEIKAGKNTLNSPIAKIDIKGEYVWFIN